jgi:predicted DNA-binding protein (UPF0251 family)
MENVTGEMVFSIPSTLPNSKDSDPILIHETQHRLQRNQASAAQMLGVTRQALNRGLKQAADKK